MDDWPSENDSWGSNTHVLNLLRGMRAASVARHEYKMEAGLELEKMRALLGEETIRQWQKGLELHSLFSRGTTHISVADAGGNIASLTASNGEGCSYTLPGTGIMLNNMLGRGRSEPGGLQPLENRRQAGFNDVPGGR